MKFKFALFFIVSIIIDLVIIAYTFSLKNLQFTFIAIALVNLLTYYISRKILIKPKYRLISVYAPLLLLFFIAIKINWSEIDAAFFLFWMKILVFELIIITGLFVFEYKLFSSHFTRRIILSLLSLIVIILIALINYIFLPKSNFSINPNRIKVIDVCNRLKSLSNSENRKLLVLWDTKCGVCKREINFLRENISSPIEYYFINDGRDSINEFINYVRFRTKGDSLNYYYPKEFIELGEITKNGVPITILLNEDNEIIEQWRGFSDATGNALLNEINSALK